MGVITTAQMRVSQIKEIEFRAFQAGDFDAIEALSDELLATWEVRGEIVQELQEHMAEHRCA